MTVRVKDLVFLLLAGLAAFASWRFITLPAEQREMARAAAKSSGRTPRDAWVLPTRAGLPANFVTVAIEGTATLTMDTSRVFWFACDNQFRCALRSAPREGGGPTVEILTTTSSRPSALQIVGDALVWLDDLSGVWRASKQPGPATKLAAIEAGARARGLTFTSDGTPTWIEGSTVTQVLDGARTKLADLPSEGRELVADGSTVYVLGSERGSVAKLWAITEPGRAKPLRTSEASAASIHSLAQDATSLFYARGGCIVRKPKSDEAEQELGCRAPTDLQALRISDGALYFIAQHTLQALPAQGPPSPPRALMTLPPIESTFQGERMSYTMTLHQLEVDAHGAIVTADGVIGSVPRE